MLEIHVNLKGEWSIIFKMDGVKVTELLTIDWSVARLEIERKCQLEMGLAKGKTLTNKTGREI